MERTEQIISKLKDGTIDIRPSKNRANIDRKKVNRAEGKDANPGRLYPS